MTPTEPPPADHPLIEVVIPKEKAVFWMDARGQWHNQHGRFGHKRIIAHFNRSIRRDQDGYYVTQVRGDIRERVYFPYADTPLFVTRIIVSDPIQLVLNTGDALDLEPAHLFTRSDQLYQGRDDERIKFSDRALLDLSPYLEEIPDGLAIRVGSRIHPILSR